MQEIFIFQHLFPRTDMACQPQRNMKAPQAGNLFQFHIKKPESLIISYKFRAFDGTI